LGGLVARKPLLVLQVVPLAPKMVVGLPSVVDVALVPALPVDAVGLPSLLVRLDASPTFLYEGRRRGLMGVEGGDFH